MNIPILPNGSQTKKTFIHYSVIVLIMLGLFISLLSIAVYWSRPYNPFEYSVLRSGQGLFLDSKVLYDWGLITRVVDDSGREIPLNSPQLAFLHYMRQDTTRNERVFVTPRLLSIPGIVDSTAKERPSSFDKRVINAIRSGQIECVVAHDQAIYRLVIARKSNGFLLFSPTTYSPAYFARVPGEEDGRRTLYTEDSFIKPAFRQIIGLLYLLIAMLVLRNQAHKWRQLLAVIMVEGLVLMNIAFSMSGVPETQHLLVNFYDNFELIVFCILIFVLLYYPQPRLRKARLLIYPVSAFLIYLFHDGTILLVLIICFARMRFERPLHRRFYAKLTRMVISTGILLFIPAAVTSVTVQLAETGVMPGLLHRHWWTAFYNASLYIRMISSTASDILLFLPFGFAMKAVQFDITSLLRGFRYLLGLAATFFLTMVFYFLLIIVGDASSSSFFLAGLIAITVIGFLHRYFRLFKWVSHDPVRVKANLFEHSFGFTQVPDYAQYFVQFLHKLYPREAVTLALPEGDFGAALVFDRELVETALQRSPSTGPLNMDIERLNETSVTGLFPAKPAPDEPALYVPIRNLESRTIGYLLVGARHKSWWDEDNAHFVRSLSAGFSRFYANLCLHIEFQKSQINLVREAEDNRRQREQAEIMAEYNRRMRDSIAYAAYIQRSILPHPEEIQRYVPLCFVLWSQRDVVGGDFYWVQPIDGGCLIAVVDCTGHGVPGALLTMSANGLLNNIVREKRITEPVEILRMLHEGITETLRQHADKEQQDGLDIALARLESTRVTFAGARLPLRIISCGDNGDPVLTILKGARFSLGGVKGNKVREFSQEIVSVRPGDRLYLTTDGIIDQPVQENGRVMHLGTKRFEAMLLSMQSESIGNQYDWLKDRLDTMTEGIDQRDDITIAGMEIGE
jgi:serine phosphatase RsbU (regulator of sigma subunit)